MELVKHLQYFLTDVCKSSFEAQQTHGYTLICNRVQRHILFVTSTTTAVQYYELECKPDKE